jgi:hypothetical protein
MNMQQMWNDTERGKPKCAERNLPHHHIHCPRMNPGLRYEKRPII